ncbi:MAG: DegT/DnrJ/EryC1/StrS family aminotransferase [Gammaproteobacteria bacterium]|jgi:dTDP-4-amino-4,6-dideoxygalactose transaminase
MAIPRQRIRLPQGAWRSAIMSLLRGDLWEGTHITNFERDFAHYISVEDAVTVPSGRAGFRFLFDSLGIEPGGEVICSAFGYPVVPFIVKSMGYDLKFVDCEMETLGMDPKLLARACSDSTEAVIATHLYGVPCQIQAIAEICAPHHVKLIEDCAHCYGASVESKKVGSFGVAGCFSFETSKVINTMGGGIVTLSDAQVGQRLRQFAAREPRNGFRWLARRLSRTSFEAAVTHPLLFNMGVYQMLRLASSKAGEADRFASGYQGDEVSLAGKMGRYTNYQALLGLRQMKSIEGRNQRRTANAERLISQLDGKIPLQKPLSTKNGSYANFMLVTVLASKLKALSAALLKKGVDTKHLYMRDCSRMFEGEQAFPNAARAEREVLHLPAYPEMSDSQIDRVARAVGDAITEVGLQADAD